MLAWYVTVPILPSFAVDVGLPASLVGIMFAARSVAEIFLRTPAGALSDNVGRRPTIILGSMFFSSGQLIYVILQKPELLFLAMFLNGVGVSVIFPASQASATEAVPSSKIGKSISLFNFAEGLSSIMGPLIGGVMANVFSVNLVLLLSFSLSALGTIAAVAFIKETIAHKSNSTWVHGTAEFGKQIIRLPETLRIILRSKQVLVPIIAVVASGFWNGATWSYYPLLAERMGFSEEMIGGGLATLGLAWTFFNLITGRISDRIKDKSPLIMTALLGYVVTLALMPSASQYWMSLTLLLLMGLVNGLLWPLVMVMIAKDILTTRRGAGMGFLMTILNISNGCALVGMSILVNFFGLMSIFYLASLASASCLILVFTTLRRLERHHS
jgi:predicted MFS family arabinose efflux permease